MNHRVWIYQLILAVPACFLVSPLPVAGQDCRSTQTHVCLALVPNSNVVPKLPDVLQVRNTEQVTIHISNVSPLEMCKLSSTAFASSPPSSAAQSAVTAVMGMAPFGIGGSLATSLAGGHNLMEFHLSKPPANPATDPIEVAIQKQSEVIKKAQQLFALQVGKQQDGNAIATMYSRFAVTDYRTPGSFGPAYEALNDALTTNLRYFPPGEPAASSDEEHRRVDSANSGGLLNGTVPTTEDPNAQHIHIIDLQSELDEAKSLVGTAHSLYDKDPKTLAQHENDFATSDRLQSNATQLLGLLTANDTALRTLQTSLATLKSNVDILRMTAFDSAGSPKESIDLPVPRAKNGTVSGSITCVNRLDNTKVTLDPMPYSVTYQLVPTLSFSAGILFSPIPKRTYGTETVKDMSAPPPTPPSPVNTYTQVAITDSSSFQVVPFSFLNLRLTPGWSYRTPENGHSSFYDRCARCARFLSRRVFSAGLSGGFGVNPNSGTADPEYFLGLFGSADRLILHLGWDRGRIQTLGGQFAVGDIVPSGTSVPTDRHFVGKLGAGISVRLYP